MAKSKGTKLASGYIELDIEYTDALKKITKDLTDLEKASKKAGDETGKNLGKAADDTAKSIEAAKKSTKELGDEAKKTSKQFDDSKKAVTEFGKGLDDSKKKASDVGDALSKGVQKGAQDAGKAVDKELSAASQRASQGIAESIIDGALKASQDGGKALSDALVHAAGEGGKALGTMIGDSRVGHWVQDMSKSVQDFRDGYITPATDAVRSLADSFRALQDHDVVGVFNGVSGAFASIGQNDAADAIARAGDKAGQVQADFFALRDGVKGTTDGLLELSSNSGRISGALEAIGAAAGPIGATVVAAKELDSALTNLGVAKYAEVPGSALWFMHQLANGWQGAKDILGNLTPFTSPDPTKGFQSPIQGTPGAPLMPLPGSAPAVQSGFEPVPGSGSPDAWRSPGSGTPKAPVNPLDILAPMDLPKHAHGGVIKGPGTGTSDSIVGIGKDGVPTSLVSRGEGVVKEAAMKDGGNQVVSALNMGGVDAVRALLPHYDQGTPVDPMVQRYLSAIQGGRLPQNGSLLPGVGGEGGLQTGTIRAKRVISALFPEISDIGGYRPPDGFNEHSSGQALDLMIPGWNTPQGKALGDQVSNFLMQNAGALGLDYTIWQHGQHNPDGSFQMYADRGSPTQNHMDHVHAHALASGYPGKDTQYSLPAQLQAILSGLGAGGAGGGANGANPAAMLGMGTKDADPATLGAIGAPGGAAERTQGYIPAGAGGGGAAGTSLFSGAAQMGAQAINGLIDQAASAAATAVSAAATAGSFGAGGEAGGAAASFAIGLATQAAKRGVQYGAQMIGILGDSAAEILMPFGVPRFFQTDPSQFMPQLPGQAAAVTTGEKAEQSQDNPNAANIPGLNPAGPVQPGQMPGQQPVGVSAPLATPGTGDFTPAATGIPGLSPTAPAPAAPAPAVGAGINPPPAPAAPAAPPAPKPQPQQPPKPPSPLDFVPFDQPGLYDDGGWLMPNQLAINKTQQPEPILNAAQWDNIGALAKSQRTMVPDPNQGSSYDYRVVIENPVVKDVNELMSEASSRQRLQMMRHAGRP